MNSIQESTTVRLHALDGVRAAMMLLGLVLHSAIAYGVLDNRGAWPFKDAHTSIICGLIVFFIHLFRMPVFYIMAGFFASMLYERRTPLGMARNRAQRILVPFVAGLVVLWPPIMMGYLFAIQAKSVPILQALVSAWRTISSQVPYESATAHLWFLYYLLMYYATFLVFVPAVRRIPEHMRAAFMNGFSKTATSRLRPLWFAIPSAVTLFMTPQGLFFGPISFIPDFRAYLGYFVFFAFGWLLFHHREILESCRRSAWTHMIVGFLLFLVTLAASIMAAAKKPGAYFIFVSCNALIVWLFAFGITGLFLRFLNRPAPAIRYVVDASYWVYLVHLPVVMWISAILTPANWPALAKAGTVLLGAIVICFISYDLLARNTFIGKILNGRRYPRGLPAAESPAAKIGDRQLFH